MCNKDIDSNIKNISFISMHEYSISKNIMERLVELKKRYPDKIITKVTITAGKFQQIVPESLFFYLDILKKDTEFFNTEFVFKENPIKIECNRCNKVSEIEEFNILCPACGCTNIQILSGNELQIESIELKGEDNGNKSI